MDDDYIWDRLDLELAQLSAGIAMDKEPDGSARIVLTARVPSVDGLGAMKVVMTYADTIKHAVGLAVRELRELIALAHMKVAAAEASRLPVGAQA